MVVICQKCEARLQVDEAKAPAPPFSIRCPKCQASVDVHLSTAADEPGASASSEVFPPTVVGMFERPASAPRFQPREQEKDTISSVANAPSVSDIARLLAAALKTADSKSRVNSNRPDGQRRKVLVCASPAYREAIAEPLAEKDYEVFVADNMAQGLGRMREDGMDIVILDANFDPLEQGVAFITREVRLLRPSQRRRLFFVYITSGVRTMDLHAAFLHNVNLVVNPSDIEQLAEALDVSTRHFNELYRPFNRALNVAPI